MNPRRNFLKLGGIAGSTFAAASVSKVALAALPELITQNKPDTMPPLVPNTGRPYNPVVTLNGWTLPWRMNAGVTIKHGYIKNLAMPGMTMVFTTKDKGLLRSLAVSDKVQFVVEAQNGQLVITYIGKKI